MADNAEYERAVEVLREIREAYWDLLERLEHKNVRHLPLIHADEVLKRHNDGSPTP